MKFRFGLNDSTEFFVNMNILIRQPTILLLFVDIKVTTDSNIFIGSLIFMWIVYLEALLSELCKLKDSFNR